MFHTSNNQIILYPYITTHNLSDCTAIAYIYQNYYQKEIVACQMANLENQSYLNSVAI